MIVHVTERYHDYQAQRYYVDTDDLDSDNPIDKLVLEACEKEGFNQEVYIDVFEKQEAEPHIGFWEDPAADGYLKRIPTKKSTVPEKTVELTIHFNC